MSLALAPLGMLYGAVARARVRLYRSGFLKSERVGAPDSRFTRPRCHPVRNSRIQTGPAV